MKNARQLLRMSNRLVPLEMQIHLPVIGATLLIFGSPKLIFVFQNWQGKNYFFRFQNIIMVFSLNVPVVSKMLDRSYLITHYLLLGLENWIEDAENAASSEDHDAVVISSVKKSEWIVEKMNEIARESKGKRSRKVYQNICSKEPFIPHSLPQLVEKSKNCFFKSPREALVEFIRLLVAAGYLTEIKVIQGYFWKSVG